MPLMTKGVYVKNIYDYAYEIEATYQMKYFVNSALIIIGLIVEPDEGLMSRFQNYAEYYHYHSDHLFYIIGQINDRLVYKNKDIVKKEYIERNVNNYCFNKTEFRI